MPLPAEGHAVVDAERRKHAPPVYQAGLAGRKKALGGIADLAVVEQKAMHSLFYRPAVLATAVARFADFTDAHTHVRMRAMKYNPTSEKITSGDHAATAGDNWFRFPTCSKNWSRPQ